MNESPMKVKIHKSEVLDKATRLALADYLLTSDDIDVVELTLKFNFDSDIRVFSIANGNEESVYLVNIRLELVVAYVDLVEKPSVKIKVKSITQKFIWRDSVYGRNIKGFATDVFFNYILPKYVTVICDELQSKKGSVMWEYFIADALAKPLNVYMVNRKGNIESLDSLADLEELLSLYDNSELYGDTIDYRDIRFVISKIAIN